MPNEKEAAPARAAQNEQLTSNQVQNGSPVESTAQEISSREPEIPDATDSGIYRAKVISLPSIRLNRYIHVLIELTFDGEPVAHLREQFDIRAPRKLMRFLQAIGEPCSDTEPFKVVPCRWCEKSLRGRSGAEAMERRGRCHQRKEHHHGIPAMRLKLGQY